MTAIRFVGLTESRAAVMRTNAGLGKGLRAAGIKAAKVVVPEAQRRAPKRSGNLAASIRARANTRGAALVAGSSKVPYAGVINFGGSVPRRGGKGQKVRSGRAAYTLRAKGRTIIPGQEFMYSAIAAKSDEIGRVYADEVTAVCRRAGLHNVVGRI